MAKKKKNVGRPTKLTNAIVKKVREFAVLGIPNQKMFATLIGLDPRTLQKWHDIGAERSLTLTQKEKQKDKPYRFYRLIEEGRAKAYAKAVQVWLKHITTHENLAAATKYLAIRDPDNWAETHKGEIKHSGEIKTGYTIEELHELAKKAEPAGKK